MKKIVFYVTILIFLSNYCKAQIEKVSWRLVVTKIDNTVKNASDVIVLEFPDNVNYTKGGKKGKYAIADGKLTLTPTGGGAEVYLIKHCENKYMELIFSGLSPRVEIYIQNPVIRHL